MAVHIITPKCIWWQVVKTVEETFVTKLLETRLDIDLGWEVHCRIV